MRYSLYPLGNEEYQDGIGSASNFSHRHYILDGGDRYIVVHYTLSTDIVSLLNSYSKISYPVGPLAPQRFDDKALADIYKAIFDSLVIFTPTKK